MYCITHLWFYKYVRIHDILSMKRSMKINEWSRFTVPLISSCIVPLPFLLLFHNFISKTNTASGPDHMIETVQFIYNMFWRVFVKSQLIQKSIELDQFSSMNFQKSKLNEFMKFFLIFEWTFFFFFARALQIIFQTNWTTLIINVGLQNRFHTILCI